MGATFVVTLREAFEASFPTSAIVFARLSPSAGGHPERRAFRDAQEVIIIHREQEYRLRITRADKLILTK